MEFKYRADDDKRPPSTSSSAAASVGHFSDLAFRAGCSQNFDFMQNPSDIYLREMMEKQRIREEIIAEEIARRKVLEAEVRRELMMEKEMAMRRAAAETGLLSEGRFSIQSDSRLLTRHFDGLLFEEQRAYTSGYRRDPSRNLLPPPEVPLRLPEPPGTEPKASSESKKDKLILLAKPDPNLAGQKRKTPTASGALALPSTSLKKSKEEWSCALCQISTSSETSLKDHIRGRKHKAREEGLRDQRMATNSTNGLTAGAEIEGKEEKSPQVNETGNDSKQKMKITDLPLKEKQAAENLGNEKETMTVAPELKKRRKFKFWCQMCSVGTYSKVVMDDHEKGKGHRARLELLKKNGEALPTTSTSNNMSSIADVVRMATDDNMVGNGTADNTKEGVDDADGSSSSPSMVPLPTREDNALEN